MNTYLLLKQKVVAAEGLFTGRYNELGPLSLLQNRVQTWAEQWPHLHALNRRLTMAFFKQLLGCK
jgi:hypothetical protein